MTDAPRVIASAYRLRIATETQADNSCGDGWRECFTSTCGAIARYWGRVSSDNSYDQIRQRYGDTTNPQAQLLALRSLGLLASFTTAGTVDLLKREVWAGRPVAVGWIHHGPAHAPVGTGHWSVVAGYDQDRLWFMDPNGEADLVRGGYVSTGHGWQGWYTLSNWRPRWEVTEGETCWRFSAGCGWALTVRDPKDKTQHAAAA